MRTYTHIMLAVILALALAVAADDPSTGPTITGSVVALDDPLPGARVRVHDVGRGTDAFAGSDEEGRFEVAVADGAYEVSVSLAGFVDSAVERVDTRRPRVLRFDLRPGPLGTITVVDCVLPEFMSVRVTDRDGRPIEAARVLLRVGTSTGRGTTDADGEFAFMVRGEDRSVYAVEVQAEGFAPGVVTGVLPGTGFHGIVLERQKR